jgi:hypothetical protein
MFQTLTLYLPHTGSAWLQKSYSNFKKHPFKPQEDELALIDMNVSITQPYVPHRLIQNQS